jgi:hypothetical protein
MSDAKVDELLDELVAPFGRRDDGWADVLTRARARRRRYALVGAVLVALVLVPASLALSGEIADLFQGTPAPPAVSTSFESNNRVADMATQRGFRDRFPHADVSKAHGVLQIQTPDGPEEVWAAPDDQGGQCWWVDFANDPSGPGGKPGSGTCDTGEHGGSISTSLGWEEPHPTLATLFGLVHVQADRVVVRLKDGSTRTLPVVEGAFLASLHEGAQLDHITAYDGDDAVASWEAPAA